MAGRPADLFAPTGPTGTDLSTAPEPGTGSGGGLELGINLVFLGLFLATAVTWLVWQYQLAASAPVRLRHSPVGHVIWWFVPFASLVVPRSAIGNLWHAYGTRRAGDPAAPTPWVFSLWWALWISPTLLMPLLFGCRPDLSGHLTGRFRSSSAFMTIADVRLRGGRVHGPARRARTLSWRALLYWSDAV